MVEYYSITKKELLTHAAMYINLRTITLSERSQMKRVKTA